MGLFAFLNSVFASIIPYPTLFVLFISLFITILVTVLNLVLIKKEVRDRIKSQMKYYQGEMKKAQKEKDMKKMQSLQKGQFEVQMEHMKESLKTTLVSIVLLWTIFAWMQSLYVPTVNLNDDGMGQFVFMGLNHTVNIDVNGSVATLETEGKTFELERGGLLVKRYQNDHVELFGRTWEVDLSKDVLKFSVVMANVPLFGNLTLIGWYILTAITFGVIFRKIFDLA